MKRTRSRTRDEYPHSLSYQASTLIKLPSTRAVDGRSTIDECALPLKSMETSSSSVASRMPRSLPAAASRNASLICCTLAGLASSAVRSTTETFGVGTRMAIPSSLPLRCGSTRPTAVAAPVVVGIMLTAPARARRRSLWGKSWIGWSFVYECTVVMKPRLMPNLSSRTLAVVARQLVVQEALLMMRCRAGSYCFSLTPSTTVTSGSFAGAVMMTFLAPAAMCLLAVAVSRKIPVDSTTTSTWSSFQGNAAGSLIAHTRISRPLTKMASPLAVTSAFSPPWTESCLSRWARVLASARSLTPTTSISPLASRAVRKNTRPMRPKPLTPTRMLMEELLVGRTLRGPYDRSKLYGRLRYTGNCEHPDRARARGAQRTRALGRRRARREHVVHQYHVRAGGRRGGDERAADVDAPLGRVQRRLRRRRAGARQPARTQRRAERARHALGEQRRLVEAALALPRACQRHRHQHRARGHGRRPLLQHERGERPRERRAATELEA